MERMIYNWGFSIAILINTGYHVMFDLLTLFFLCVASSSRVSARSPWQPQDFHDVGPPEFIGPRGQLAENQSEGRDDRGGVHGRRSSSKRRRAVFRWPLVVWWWVRGQKLPFIDWGWLGSNRIMSSCHQLGIPFFTSQWHLGPIRNPK